LTEGVHAVATNQGFNLSDFLVYLIASVVMIPLFKRFKFSPVLGYLAGGALIGPFGLRIIHDAHESHSIAEYGIVFLMFTIGLELSFERLKVMRRYVFGLGSLQFILSGLSIGFIVWLLGYNFSAIILLGGGLALSSTAFVIKLLSDRSELSTKYGRAAFAILLLQDLAVVPLLAVIPLLHKKGEVLGMALGLALAKAIIALVLIIFLGRTLLRPIYRIVALSRSPEVFVAMTLLAVLGTGLATYSMGLSMALGAFLAGLLIAETEYRHQVEADIQPFRGILLGIFFISIGMEINFPLAFQNIGLVLVLIVGLMLLKTVILFFLARLFSLETAPAIKVALILSQGGEFAFVLLTQAAPLRILPQETSQLIYVVVAFTMALTPFVVSFFWPYFEKIEKQTNTRLEWLAEETEDLKNHVIIAGYGHVGKTVSKLLATRSIPFVAVDVDAGRVAKGRADGTTVYYGDASLGEVLRAVGAARAKAIVITLGEPKLTARAVASAHLAFPNIEIIVRAKDGHHVRDFQRLGADSIVPEALEASLQLGGIVLKHFGIHADEVSELIQEFRRQGIFPDNSSTK
jgi:monovalent cation:H+ antiporter-2, CPA2 family